MSEAVKPQSELSALDREPFAWLRERDIDLLLCCELHADGAFTSYIERVVGLDGATFEGAWVSHSELNGESDLLIAWQATSGKHIVLVENKIAAGFQPDQAARYAERARSWEVQEKVASARTMLLAPQAYVASAHGEPFDYFVTYEDICSAMRSASDPRSRFMAEALEAGVAAYHRGYVANADPFVSSAWQVLWEIAGESTPKLNMSKPTSKPAKSTWIYFREAEGLSSLRNRVLLVYKAERGHADLQFRGADVTELSGRVASLLHPTMEVHKAGKSSSIRMSVPSIDFSSDVGGQREEAQFGFAACEQLRKFFLVHRDALLVQP